MWRRDRLEYRCVVWRRDRLEYRCVVWKRGESRSPAYPPFINNPN